MDFSKIKVGKLIAAFLSKIATIEALLKTRFITIAVL